MYGKWLGVLSSFQVMWSHAKSREVTRTHRRLVNYFLLFSLTFTEMYSKFNDIHNLFRDWSHAKSREVTRGKLPVSNHSSLQKDIKKHQHTKDFLFRQSTYMFLFNENLQWEWLLVEFAIVLAGLENNPTIESNLAKRCSKATAVNLALQREIWSRHKTPSSDLLSKECSELIEVSVLPVERWHLFRMVSSEGNTGLVYMNNIQNWQYCLRWSNTHVRIPDPWCVKIVFFQFISI